MRFVNKRAEYDMDLKMNISILNTNNNIYYIPVICLAQIQVSHAGEIQHDEKKIPIYTQ